MTDDNFYKTIDTSNLLELAISADQPLNSILSNPKYKQNIQWWKKRYFGNKKSLIRKHLDLIATHAATIREHKNDTTFSHIWDCHTSEEVPHPKESSLLNVLYKLCLPPLSYALIETKKTLQHTPNCRQEELLQGYMEHLFQKLQQSLTPALVMEANLYRIRSTSSSSPEDNFKSFCRGAFASNEEIHVFWKKHPVLWRIISTLVQNTTSAACETIRRIHQDRLLIQETFKILTEQPLTHIEWGSGDSHKEGRVVAICHFKDQTLVYKPRSMKADYAYNNFISWFSQKTKTLSLKSYVTLDRNEYGYCEHIKWKDNLPLTSLHGYYEKIGALTAIAWFLGITDLHYENLISSGNDPYLIDLETILDPLPLYQKTKRKVQNLHFFAISDLLFRTGLIPTRQKGENGIYDTSAIGVNEIQPSPYKVLDMENYGRDDLRLIHKKGQFIPEHNMPLTEDKTVTPALYQNDIINGFKSTLQTLHKNKKELRSASSPLSLFNKIPIRWVARNTMDYGNILQGITHPSVTKDPIECDMFIAGHLWSLVGESPHLTPLISSELKELWKYDIPYFWTYTNSTDVFGSTDHSYKDFFAKSGWALLQRRIDQLGKLEELQTQAIKLSLSSTVKTEASTDINSYYPTEKNQDNLLSDTKTQCLNQACKIGDTLINSAHFIEHAPLWIGLSPLEENNFTAGVMPPTLYDGVPGIGLFLGALYSVTKEKKYKKIALHSHAFVKQLIKGITSGWSCGAFCGYGSLLYADLCLSSYLNTPTLCSDPKIVRKFIKLIKEDTNYDIISGAAGALIIAIRCYHHTKRQDMLQAAETAATILIKNAEKQENGCAWNSMKDFNYPKKLGGMAHGVSGISWALAEWYNITKEPNCAEIVRQAVAYEQSCFDPNLKTWRDTRYNSHACHWCYGAVGIGLAFDRMRSILGDQKCDELLAQAKMATWKYGLSSNQCLCHGNIGNTEIFLSAGDTKNAQNIIDWTLEEYNDKGHWNCDLPNNVSTPGLMCGISGVGYGLLRNAYPEIIPSILTLDTPHQQEKDK